MQLQSFDTGGDDSSFERLFAFGIPENGEAGGVFRMIQVVLVAVHPQFVVSEPEAGDVKRSFSYFCGILLQAVLLYVVVEKPLGIGRNPYVFLRVGIYPRYGTADGLTGTFDGNVERGEFL